MSTFILMVSSSHLLSHKSRVHAIIALADDIVENVVDRYLDGPEDSNPSSSSAVGSDSGHHVEQQDAVDLGMQNANLRRKLEQVLKERDQARDMVAAMRRVVHD